MQEAAGPATAVAAIPASAPQIAYLYRYGFRLAPEVIAAIQPSHVAQRDALGPARCRLGEMTRAT